VVEALGVHFDPQDLVVGVDIDGEAFSAGDEALYSRRSAAKVGRLCVTTNPPEQVAERLRGEVLASLEVIAAKAESAARCFRRSEAQRAQQILATLFDELRLTLILDQQVAVVGKRQAMIPTDAVESVASDLLSAQQRSAVREMPSLLEERLAPMLRGFARA
jgi:hypothetical protein